MLIVIKHVLPIVIADCKVGEDDADADDDDDDDCDCLDIGDISVNNKTQILPDS